MTFEQRPTKVRERATGLFRRASSQAEKTDAGAPRWEQAREPAGLQRNEEKN